MQIGTDHFISEILPSDASAYLQLLNNKQIYDRTLNIPHPYTQTHAESWMKHVADETSKYGGVAVNWAIRSSDGSLVGGIGLQNFELGISHKAEIGYWLAEPHWGKGIMTKVVRIASHFALRKLALKKLTANVFAFNRASSRSLKKRDISAKDACATTTQKMEKYLTDMSTA